MEKEDIIEKIKKCLALSASSNEFEAAAALRQARKLMEAYGITEFDVETSEIEESDVGSGVKTKPSSWEAALVDAVEMAFGCQSIFYSGFTEGKWKFIGFSPAPDLAQYSFTVLFRQVKRARAAHIKSSLKRCKPATKTRRADLFCEGWVSTATGLVYAFSRNEEAAMVIEKYIERKYRPQSFAPQNRNAGKKLRPYEVDDYYHGKQKGKDAILNHGLAGSSSEPLKLK